VFLVSLKDWGTGQHDSLIGDALSLGSACAYGVYTTVLKMKIEDDRCVDMLQFFGLLGSFNVLLLWPLFFV
jgi:solute carrier family 35 protein F5